jgi:GT2 family glycosyltransferase
MGENYLCDIIIPVYNAPDELEECVNSILQNTQVNAYRIIIINDCSPDPKVNDYLNALKHLERIIILNNERNLGFVGTVNKGMSYSNHDVLLLNSDTIVTSGWLRNIMDAAYSDESVATVTPLTNNGEICSVPNFCQDNTIPDGYTIDSFASFIERISLKLYPEIPTGVGFCMFIKRNVLNEIGLFDVETFGKGYGEENDFCCRVIEHGYKNILADNVFIYHKGSMSFQGKKLELVKQNTKLLNDRYPYYEKTIRNFILENPLMPIHQNIHFRLDQSRNSYFKKGNVLYVLHNFFDEAYNHPIGGTELHVKDLIEGIKEYSTFLLVTNTKEVVLKQYNEGKLVGRFRFPLREPIKLTHFHHKEYAELVEKIINSFDIGLIHIHHLLKHSFDIPAIAHKNGIKTIFTLHDYYLFCPRIQLVDEFGVYCENIRSESKCRDCLHATLGFHTPFLKKWKEQVTLMMKNIDLFICPSKSVEKMFVKEFNTLEERIITLEHGTDERLIEKESLTRMKKTLPLKVGFIGGISPIKGSDLIYSLIISFPKDKVEWHIIGGLGDQKINLLNQKNLVKHGEYERDQLDRILDQINLDLVCLLPIVPETYSYTLSEAWRNRIPVLVTPMGALKERVEAVGGGWILSDYSLPTITNKLNQIINQSEEAWEKVLNNISNYQHRNKKIMCDEYIEIYNQKRIEIDFSSSKKQLDNHSIMCALKYYMPNDGISLAEYNNQVNQLQNELNAIRDTIGWKVLNKLREKNSFVLKLGKRFIYFGLKLKRKF